MYARNDRISNIIDAKPAKSAASPVEVKSNKSKASKFVDPEDVVRREIRQAVGKIDPLIKAPVEDILKTNKYKRKTKFDVMDDTVERLDKKVQNLQAKRFESFQDPRKETWHNALLELDPEVEYEDLLEEGEVRRAFENKDTDKMELILLKSKVRLEEFEKKLYGGKLSDLEVEDGYDFGTTAMSGSMGRSLVGTLWDRGHADRNAPYLDSYKREQSPNHSKMDSHRWNGYAKIDKEKTIPCHIYSEVKNNFNPGTARPENAIVYRTRNPSSSPYVHQYVNIHSTGGSLGVQKVMKHTPHVRPYPGSQYLVEYEETGRKRSSSPIRNSQFNSPQRATTASQVGASPVNYKVKGSPYNTSYGESPLSMASTAVSQAFNMNQSGRYNF